MIPVHVIRAWIDMLIVLSHPQLSPAERQQLYALRHRLKRGLTPQQIAWLEGMMEART